jgi:hypothetical protein
LAKFKKGERLRVSFSNSWVGHEGVLTHLERTKRGNLIIQLEKDNELPVMFAGDKESLSIERI